MSTNINDTPITTKHGLSGVDIPTPPSTEGRPIRGSRAPMIVDITLDKSGKQIYQIHKTNGKKSKKARSMSDYNDEGFDDSNSRYLDSSPTSNKKRLIDQDKGNGNTKRKHIKRNSSSASSKENRSPNSDHVDTDGDADATIVEQDNNADSEIWSEDVEGAFKESLAIIPKQGLSKIKISGRSCGRNELISEYIMTKTGKFRTRKQVSSHIQVIKNTKKDQYLIDIILNGPPKDAETVRKFDEIFGKISLAKSVGAVVGTISKDSLDSRQNSQSDEKQQNQYEHSPMTPVKVIKSRQVIAMNDLQKIEITLKNFTMSYMNFNYPQDSHYFTRLPEDFMKSPLRIRTNANLKHRFPQLFELIDGIKSKVSRAAHKTASSNSKQVKNVSIPPVPILHGMVKLVTPSLNKDIASGKYNASSSINITNLPASDDKYCCLTVVYSFGRRILTTFEKLDAKSVNYDESTNAKEVNFDLRLGTNYWHDFFNGIHKLLNTNLAGDTRSVIGSEEEVLSKAIKGITMKQVIFNNDEEYDDQGKFDLDFSLDDIEKSSVRSIILWEFLKVDTDMDVNVTTMRRMHLPNGQPASTNQSAPPPSSSEILTNKSLLVHESHNHHSQKQQQQKLLNHAKLPIKSYPISTTASSITNCSEQQLTSHQAPQHQSQELGTMFPTPITASVTPIYHHSVPSGQRPYHLHDDQFHSHPGITPFGYKQEIKIEEEVNDDTFSVNSPMNPLLYGIFGHPNHPIEQQSDALPRSPLPTGLQEPPTPMTGNLPFGIPMVVDPSGLNYVDLATADYQNRDEAVVVNQFSDTDPFTTSCDGGVAVKDAEDGLNFLW